MVKPLYFISDVHLGFGSPEHERDKREKLLLLFDEIEQQAECLYIVGDLFDFWFEYKHAIPKGHHAVLAALERLVRRGVPVTYMAGNHDFAIGSYFEEELGVRVVHDDIRFTYDGKTFYLYHGDGLAVKDTGYKILKSILRNRAAQWAFRWLHPDVGIGLARTSSHSSRQYTSGKKYGPIDGMRLEAEKQIQAGADYVIMGHRHIPAMEQIAGGLYINLGDWLRYYSYARYERGEVRMYTIKEGASKPLDTE